MKKIYFAVILYISLWLTVACTVIKPQPIIKQESLLEYCSSDTPLPTNFTLDKDGNKVYDGEEIYNTMISWHFMYNECAIRHDKLVDAIRDLQNDRTMITKPKG